MSTPPAVIFGGPSPEHDVSVSTGLQVCRSLEEVIALYWSLNGDWYQVSSQLEVSDFVQGIPPGSKPIRPILGSDGGFYYKRKRLDVSVVLLATHGGPGEDGTLASMLEMMHLRYSGPNPANSQLCMDKLNFTAVAAQLGIPVLPRQLVSSHPPDFPPPYIVKPRRGGSSLGIEVVSDLSTAQALVEVSPHYVGGGVIEPWLEEARDIQIAVRTFPQWQHSDIESPESNSTFLEYQEKYLAWGSEQPVSTNLIELEPRQHQQVVSWAEQITERFGLRSVARIDFLAAGEEIWLNEVNTIPGSLAAYLWSDLPRKQLLSDIIMEMQEMKAPTFSTAGADGKALRSAGTVAAKLS